MKQKIKDLFLKNKDFIKDNALLLFSIGFLGLCGYIFHFLVARSLGPADYGTINGLLSFNYLVIVILTFIQLIVAGLASKSIALGNKGQLTYLFKYSKKKLIFIGVGLSILFLILSPLIKDFFNFESIFPLQLWSLFIVFWFLLPINRGLLQGMQSFKKLGINYVLEGLTKLFGGFIFIKLGFGISGVMLAIILSILIPYLFSILQLRNILNFKPEKIDFIFSKDSFFTLATLFSLTFFYTADVLLVKHFFENTIAGLYSSIALLGRIIFFAASSVSMVLFPKVSQLHHLGKKHFRTLYYSLFLVILVGAPFLLIYLLFPNVVISSLFGSDYFVYSSLLWKFGLIMILFTLVYTISFYNLAIKKYMGVYLLILFNILQTIFILIFHNNIGQIISILLYLISIQFILLLIILKLSNNKNKFLNN
ncbi:MAG: oligosaccharide flippase family protein [Nanoarchaeota archaeon]|nr:oligosaccharide flippase family protein [Nanoarchaeota archaeon]